MPVDLERQFENAVANCAKLQDEIARLELEKHVLLVACEDAIRNIANGDEIDWVRDMKHAVSLVRKGG